MTARPDTAGRKVIATNRNARRDVDVLETIEAGLVLKGSEVKSLRAGHVQFADANGWIRDGEAFLLGIRIQPWETATGVFGHDPDRQRKLLLHKG
jgi:SsrA-binding protein